MKCIGQIADIGWTNAVVMKNRADAGALRPGDTVWFGASSDHHYPLRTGAHRVSYSDADAGVVYLEVGPRAFTPAVCNTDYIWTHEVLAEWSPYP